jgi:uncharacterized protein YndB with AHSA1/START domain
MTTTTDNPVLEIVRLFDATPEAVFDAWLEREQWQAWIGPEGVHCNITQFEPRVGGRYGLTMNMVDGRQIPVRGEFTIVDRPHRFAMTWGKDGGTLVTVRLRAVDAKTELTLRHEGFEMADRESFVSGWSSALNKLARYVKGETP